MEDGLDCHAAAHSMNPLLEVLCGSSATEDQLQLPAVPSVDDATALAATVHEDAGAMALVQLRPAASDSAHELLAAKASAAQAAEAQLPPAISCVAAGPLEATAAAAPGTGLVPGTGADELAPAAVEPSSPVEPCSLTTTASADIPLSDGGLDCQQDQPLGCSSSPPPAGGHGLASLPASHADVVPMDVCVGSLGEEQHEGGSATPDGEAASLGPTPASEEQAPLGFGAAAAAPAAEEGVLQLEAAVVRGDNVVLEDDLEDDVSMDVGPAPEAELAPPSTEGSPALPRAAGRLQRLRRAPAEAAAAAGPLPLANVPGDGSGTQQGHGEEEAAAVATGGSASPPASDKKRKAAADARWDSDSSSSDDEDGTGAGRPGLARRTSAVAAAAAEGGEGSAAAVSKAAKKRVVVRSAIGDGLDELFGPPSPSPAGGKASAPGAADAAGGQAKGAAGSREADGAADEMEIDGEWGGGCVHATRDTWGDATAWWCSRGRGTKGHALAIHSSCCHFLGLIFPERGCLRFYPPDP